MDEHEALDQRREFLEQQRSGLGATDTPKILGLSRYGSPLSVYQSKVEGLQDRPSSLPAWLGMQLQSTVAELYRTATGNTPRADNRHHRHHLYPYIVCHLDYRVKGNADILVECKTRAYMKGWGEDGSAIVPPDVYAQVQHELLVTGARECHVATLFGHHTFRVYPIPRDVEFIAELTRALNRFWHDHILLRVPPEPIANDGPRLQERHPQDDEHMLSATPEQAALVSELISLRAMLAEGIKTVEEQENRIKAAIGDHAGLLTPYGTVTWKRTKDRRYVDWEAVATELGPTMHLVDSHTTIKPGVRRFLLEETTNA